jgi:hypothetical protein
MKEAFNAGVVIAVSLRTHTTNKIMRLEQLPVDSRAMLATAIRMYNKEVTYAWPWR